MEDLCSLGAGVCFLMLTFNTGHMLIHSRCKTENVYSWCTAWRMLLCRIDQMRLQWRQICPPEEILPQIQRDLYQLLRHSQLVLLIGCWMSRRRDLIRASATAKQKKVRRWDKRWAVSCHCIVWWHNSQVEGRVELTRVQDGPASFFAIVCNRWHHWHCILLIHSHGH